MEPRGKLGVKALCSEGLGDTGCTSDGLIGSEGVWDSESAQGALKVVHVQGDLTPFKGTSHSGLQHSSKFSALKLRSSIPKALHLFGLFSKPQQSSSDV